MSSKGNKYDISILLSGDTGMGKSSFGNLFCGKELFKASDSPNPVTLEAVMKYVETNEEVR